MRKPQSNTREAVTQVGPCTSYPSLCNASPPPTPVSSYNNEYLPSCSSVGQVFGCVSAGCVSGRVPWDCSKAVGRGCVSSGGSAWAGCASELTHVPPGRPQTLATGLSTGLPNTEQLDSPWMCAPRGRKKTATPPEKQSFNNRSLERCPVTSVTLNLLVASQCVPPCSRGGATEGITGRCLRSCPPREISQILRATFPPKETPQRPQVSPEAGETLAFSASLTLHLFRAG